MKRFSLLIIAMAFVFVFAGCGNGTTIVEDPVSPGNGGDPPTTFTIIFILDGGRRTIPGAQPSYYPDSDILLSLELTVYAGSSIILPGGDVLYKEGCTLIGWNTTSDLSIGTSYPAFSSFTPTDYYTVPLYAIWSNREGDGPNPFIDTTWIGYYPESVMIYTDFSNLDWSIGYDNHGDIKWMSGYYNSAGNSAVLRNYDGSPVGSISLSGNAITVNIEGWRPFALSKRAVGGTTSGTSVNGRLSSIPLILGYEDIPGSNCVVECTRMIEEYYFGRSNDRVFIWDKIRATPPRPGAYSYKAGFYLEVTRNLYVSVVHFSDLQRVLGYLESNQIPAIMSIRDDANYWGGKYDSHAIVFTGYDASTGYVTVRDPADIYTRIHYYDLLSLFDIRDTIDNDNHMLIVSNRPNNMREFSCWNCGNKFLVDSTIMQAIDNVECTFCNYRNSVR